MRKGRFPWVLTIASVLAFAVLCSLGMWQIQRLHWKQGLIREIESRQSAVPLDLDSPDFSMDALSEWTRASAKCLTPQTEDRNALVYTLHEGQIAWRLWSVCRLKSGFAVVVDRGFFNAAQGDVAPAAVVVAPAGAITGLLRRLPDSGREPSKPVPIQGGLRFAQPTLLAMQQLLARSRGVQATGMTFYLAAQTETPAALGVSPQASPPDLPNNHLGYAITWFGLALALAGVYVTMLLRKLRS